NNAHEIFPNWLNLAADHRPIDDVLDRERTVALRKDHSTVARDWLANGHDCPGFTGLSSCAFFRKNCRAPVRAMIIGPMVHPKVHPLVVSNLGQQSQPFTCCWRHPKGNHAEPSFDLRSAQWLDRELPHLPILPRFLD